MNLKPTTIEETQDIVRTHEQILPYGGGSKPALSSPLPQSTRLDLSALSGVLEYDPGEFTFTAWAGTPLQAVNHLLAAQGQYLPFDPLLAEKGATLGGTVASGTAGPGRLRYGGVRDFLLGIRFVDGQGQVVRGGGKVVKNSAGFDLPKLMVGSLGRLGVLLELTFKVFPRPAATATLQADFSGLRPAIEAIQQLSTSHLEMDALDLEPPGRVWIRLGGLHEALPDRLSRIKDFLKAGSGDDLEAIDILADQADTDLWQRANSLHWVPAGWGLIKVPLTPGRIFVLEKHLDGQILGEQGVKRRYSVGGNVAWLAWSPPEDGLTEAQTYFTVPDSILTRLELAGLTVLGPAGHPFLGLRNGEGLLKRVKQALDPTERFLTY